MLASAGHIKMGNLIIGNRKKTIEWDESNENDDESQSEDRQDVEYRFRAHDMEDDVPEVIDYGYQLYRHILVF